MLETPAWVMTVWWPHLQISLSALGKQSEGLRGRNKDNASRSQNVWEGRGGGISVMSQVEEAHASR